MANRDPIEEEGGTNLFSFNGNCATAMIDYLGLTGLDPCKVLCDRVQNLTGEIAKQKAIQAGARRELASSMNDLFEDKNKLVERKEFPGMPNRQRRSYYILNLKRLRDAIEAHDRNIAKLERRLGAAIAQLAACEAAEKRTKQATCRRCLTWIGGKIAAPLAAATTGWEAGSLISEEVLDEPAVPEAGQESPSWNELLGEGVNEAYPSLSRVWPW